MRDCGEMKNILIIIPNLGGGGAQKVYLQQVACFSEIHNVVACVFNTDGALSEQSDSILSLNVSAGANWFSKIYFFLQRIKRLRQIKRQYNIDYAISHLEGADYVNLFSRQNEKVICCIHGSKSFDRNIEGMLGWLRKKILIPLTYKRSDRIITVSEGIRQELIRNFQIPSEKIKTIYNGFDLEDISSKANEPITEFWENLFSDETVLITHCRLSRQKNLHALVEIFHLLKIEADCKLVILGDGELRESIKNQCHSLGLKVYRAWDNASPASDYDVFFLGYQKNPYPFLRRASLYLMTSLWEGFPLALCEAMACEVPVLSADCYTGPREIIAPGLIKAQPVVEPVITPYGVLMPLPDSKPSIQEWVKTIKQVLADDSQQGAVRAEGKVRVGIFDKRKITSQWLNELQ
jgi:glycosyltransferase involved in cell wall biosynthesis